MAATHSTPGHHPSDVPYNKLIMPAHPDVSLEATRNISIDDFSLSLLLKAPEGTRFAWVGWFVKEEEIVSLKLSCRPGFPSDISEEGKQEVKKFYNNEIVIANTGNPGQVHDETISLVNKRRQSQGLPLLPNIRKGSESGYPMIGFSSVKQSSNDLKFTWLNRSIYNTTSFTVDLLASARWLIGYHGHTNILMYHIERSIPIRFFEKNCKFNR